MKVKGVIFDMDGLMIDSERLAYDTTIEAAKEFGYELDGKLVLRSIGMNEKDTIEMMENELGKDFPYAKIHKAAVELRYAHYEHHPVQPKEGLIELLEYLKDKNILIAVASSTRKERVIHQIKTVNAYKYVDYIIGGDQVVNSKPNPEIFLKALKGLNIKADEALVLEDSKNGILSSVNAGIKVICIPDMVHHDKEITDLTYKTLPSLLNVKEYID